MSPIGEWISGKVFRYVHGNHLVYNTCWEDPRLDKVAMELGPDDNVMVITSAGCNALSYALAEPHHVYTVDMNPRQNAVLELKIAGIKHLDFETFFKIFGNGRYTGIETLYKGTLRQHLSPWSQSYWDRKIKKYFDGKRKSFYFCGTAGTFARHLNRYIDYVRRMRPAVNELLASQTMEEQREIWKTKIRPKLWTRTVRFAVSRDSTLSMLGVPRAQRKQIDTQYKGGILHFVMDALDSVFSNLPIADNYFWRVYSTGSYTKTCCPEYLEEANFNALKNGLVDKISVTTDTVEGFLRKNPDIKISRFVLLDHMDWLSDKLYDALVSEWDAILTHAAPHTRILWRSGGLRTEYIDTVPVKWQGQDTTLGQLLSYNVPLATELHQKDRVHTYGSFYIVDLPQTETAAK